MDGNHRVVLFTYVFSQSAAEKRYLRMFLETAVTSGVDVVVIGDVAPPHQPAGRHYLVSWEEFCDRVQKNVLDGHDPTRLRAAPDAYKIIDFKPLTAALFPELVQGYEWWGHADNDMLLGSIHSQVLPFLDDYDVISGIGDHPTWGPFTLFRNHDVINTLYRNATVDLREMFDTEKPVCFDEWGQCAKRRGGGLTSMSAIVEAEAENPSIRVHQVGFSLTWDGVCKFRALGGTRDPQCGTCSYSAGTLRALNKEGKWEETLLCHYEYAKARLETSLENQPTFDSILSAREFEVSFREGFKPIQYHPQPHEIASTTAAFELPEPRGKAMENMPKVLLATFVFSEEAANKNYLRLFAQTASTSGAESVWIIGDTAPSFTLPPHVHHFPISWVELCDLINKKLSIPVDNLKAAKPYKVNDLKPLTAFLFPELVAGFDFWGSCDNDLLVGDLRQLWPRQDEFDVLSGSADHATWGPMTLYRNTATTETLFQQATISLERIFNNEKPVCFDEWGSCGFKRWPGATMAGIVEKSALRVAHAPTGWDGWCHLPRFGKSKHRCAECLYRNGGLWLRNETGRYDEVLVCHYQYTKSRLQSSMEEEEVVAEMLQRGEFQVNYLDGAKPLPSFQGK